jgi:hypothetical protein
MQATRFYVALVAMTVLFAGCASQDYETTDAEPTVPEGMAEYTTFRLTSDLSGLSDSHKQMIPLLIEAGQAMDAAFWVQAYGDKAELISKLDSPALVRYAETTTILSSMASDPSRPARTSTPGT